MPIRIFKFAVLTLLWGVWTPLHAGTTGKLSGVIKDKETGDALPGVNVVVEGTSIGAVTNRKGEYLVLFVPAGQYSIEYSLIGFTKMKMNEVIVLPDFNTVMDVSLAPADVLGEEIVVIAERSLIQQDQTMTMTVMTFRDYQNLPARGYQKLTNLAANYSVGVVVNNDRDLEGNIGNVNVRGGRPNETGVYIDGFLQNSLVTGFSNANLPHGSLEEVVLITGSFDAEYGKNQSGILQVTTRSGKKDYSGFLEWVGDPFGFGLAPSYGYHTYSGGLGGTVPYTRLKFFVSGEGRYIDDAEPSVFGFPKFQLSNKGSFNPDTTLADTLIFATDKQGNVLYHDRGPRPKNSSGNGINSDKGYTFQTKLSYDIIPNKLMLDASGNYSGTWRRSFVTSRTIRDAAVLRVINNLNLGFTSTLIVNDHSFVDAGMNYYANDRKIMNDLLGFHLASYTAQVAQVAGTPTISYYGDNLLFNINYGPLTFRRDHDSYMAFKSNYSNQLDKNIEIKSGLDLYQHVVRYLTILQINNPAYGLSDLIGYQIRPDTTIVTLNKDDLENKRLGAAHPYSASSYIQSKLEYSGFVLRTGVRFDLFNAGSKRIKNLSDPTGQEDKAQEGKFTDKNDNQTNERTIDRQWAGSLGPEDYMHSKSSYAFSPRFSVSFPVSDKTQFRMSCGRFFQQPPLQDLYGGPLLLEHVSLFTDVATIVGNPNLKPVRSTQSEIGLRRNFSDLIILDAAIYYKDVEKLINVVNVTSKPNNLYVFENSDEGVIKGLNVSLELKRTGKFQGRLAYTIQSAKGTGSWENSNFDNAWLGFRTTQFNAPLDYDQRHTISANLDIRNTAKEGPVLNGKHFLENAGVNMQMNFGSGFPYTPTVPTSVIVYGVPQNKTVVRRNSERLPWTLRIDMRADKTFYFSNSANVNAYIVVMNVFDRKNVTHVFGSTGNADNDGWLAEPDARNYSERQIQQYTLYYHDGLNYGTPRQVRLGVAFTF